MPERPLSQVPGWYGKLATLGDFASRRLPDEVVHALDTWLAACIAGSRQQLGERWLEQYLASPLQRFVLGPGLLQAGGGPVWWFGVLMASCDKVGRYFPLVVLQPRAAAPADRIGLDHLELWWQCAGEAALQTLADDVDAERFDQALGELPPWPALGDAGVAVPASVPAHGAAQEWAVPAGRTLGELAQGMAAAACAQRLQGQSLWWAWRPEPGDTPLRITAGLPTAAMFAAMLGA